MRRSIDSSNAPHMVTSWPFCVSRIEQTVAIAPSPRMVMRSVSGMGRRVHRPEFYRIAGEFSCSGSLLLVERVSVRGETCRLRTRTFALWSLHHRPLTPPSPTRGEGKYKNNAGGAVAPPAD